MNKIVSIKNKALILCLTLTILLAHSLSFVSNAHAANEISDKELREAIIRILKNEPEILFNVMEENSVELIQTITKASEIMRSAKLEEAWQKDVQNPKSMDLKNRPIQGKANAKNIIVGYSDFLCSYCAQAAKTMHSLMAKRNDIKFVFKANPKNEQGRNAALWFYHLSKKDSKKAWIFHDSLFANQATFAKDPTGTIKTIVNKLGLDADKMEKEINADKKNLEALINADIKEAKDMQLSGTPYFIVNDVIIRGAHPLQTFEKAIEFTNKK